MNQLPLLPPWVCASAAARKMCAIRTEWLKTLYGAHLCFLFTSSRPCVHRHEAYSTPDPSKAGLFATACPVALPDGLPVERCLAYATSKR